MSGAEGIKVYNDLTRRRETFTPLEGGRVGMYVCGVTVYDVCHVGHARAYITFDVIRRYLEYRGYKVLYVQNFTDIDDKIINRSAKEGVDFHVVTERYIDAYFRDMDALNIRRADIYPKATETIPEIVEMVAGLVEKGFAYTGTDGSVLFEVEKLASYGQLFPVDRKEKELTEADTAAGKRHPADFALWKASKPGEPVWESPWGPGRPGWHIECSAMALKHIGETLDIHGGGQDLIFPHHENEIAQSESFTGKQFTRYWIHNGFIQIEEEKMSKSLGNMMTIEDVLKEFSPDTMRQFFLNAHYRMPLSFSKDRLHDAKSALDRISIFISGVSQIEGGAEGESDAASDLIAAIGAARKAYEEAMDDDFNTPGAVAAVFSLVREANPHLVFARSGEAAPGVVAALRSTRDAVLQLLGVLGFTPALGAAGGGGREDALVRLLIDIRARLRKEKNFALADDVRKQLEEIGVLLEDGPKGTTWRNKD